MGANVSKALGKIFGNKEMRILMLGLDAAGKTSKLGRFFFVLSQKFDIRCPCSNALRRDSLYHFRLAILYKLKLNQSVTTIPTVGFNVESVTYKNVKFNVSHCACLWHCPWRKPKLKSILLLPRCGMWAVRTKFATCGDIITLVHRV
jgi:hypothetical protein